MDKSKLDLENFYQTTVEMFKHFNSLIDRIRIVVITSGVLGYIACGKLFVSYYNEDSKICENNILLIILIISFWGLLFVLAMLFLGIHYLIHTESIANSARQTEKKMSEKGAFWRIYKDHHQKKSPKLKSQRDFNFSN